jgi:hypothetical protein
MSGEPLCHRDRERVRDARAKESSVRRRARHPVLVPNLDEAVSGAEHRRSDVRVSARHHSQERPALPREGLRNRAGQLTPPSVHQVVADVLLASSRSALALDVARGTGSGPPDHRVGEPESAREVGLTSTEAR